MAAQECTAKIDSFAARASSAEEKVFSATKLVRLAQTYSEEQGHEQARINDAFEDRLDDLERRLIHSRGASQTETARRFPPERDECSSSHLRPSPPDHPVSPGLPAISAAGLSDWMQGVDQQLEDLRERVASSQEDCEAPAVTKSDGDERSPHGGVTVQGGRREMEEEACSPSGETDATSSHQAQDQPRSVEPPAASELARLDERLRRLEEGASTVAASPDDDARQSLGCAPLSGEDTNDENETSHSARGRRAKISLELALGDSPRSPSSSPIPRPSLRESCSPVRTNVVDVATGAKSSPDSVIVEALEEGKAAARRASELAEEALKVGREAAARSERTEGLAKCLAAKSSKLAEDQRDQVNEALNRINEELQKNRGSSDGDEECRRLLANKAWEEERTTTPYREAAVGPEDCPRVATVVDGIDVKFTDSAVANRGASDSRPNRAHGRRHRTPTEVVPAPMQTQDPFPTGCRRGRSRPRVVADECREPSNSRPARDIRSTVKRVTVNDVSRRQVALGAAGTALESILRGASRQQAGHEADVSEAGKERGLPAGSMMEGFSNGDSRKVDEMRQAIQGAVKILAGISRPYPSGERQRLPSRSARRVLRQGVRSSQSQERTKSSPVRDRDRSKHVGGYWVPPGSVPYKVGERRGRMMSVRAPWDGREDEAGEETLASFS